MTAVLPRTIGGTVDRLFRLRAKRLELSKKVDAIKAEEAVLRDHAAKMMRAQKTDKATGKLASFSVGSERVGQVDDWPELWKWIEKNKAHDLVQRRLNNGALRDRVDEGEKPEGVRVEKVPKYSLTKRGAK